MNRKDFHPNHLAAAASALTNRIEGAAIALDLYVQQWLAGGPSGANGTTRAHPNEITPAVAASPFAEVIVPSAGESIPEAGQ